MRMGVRSALAGSVVAFAALPNRHAVHDPAVALPPCAGVAAALGSDGLELRVGGRHARLSARTLTRSGRPAVALERTAPVVTARGAEVGRGAGTLEYVRPDAQGVEQGFVLDTRPEGVGDLVLRIEVRGQLAPRPHGDEVELVDEGGVVVAHYARLAVLDARGQRMASHMTVEGRYIALHFDDDGATYPVVVDPVVYSEAQKLLAWDRQDLDWFGRAVAMSGDGTRLVIGAIRESDATGSSTNQNGAAYVFVRSGTQWVMERKLLASDKANLDWFGYSLAMNSDGSRIAVGAMYHGTATPTATTENGAVYVFSRAGTTWSEETQLLASDRADRDHFGHSVAMSADGTRIAVGAYDEDDATGTATTNNGAVYVYSWTGASWTEERKIVAADKGSDENFGGALSFDATASRLAIAAEDDSDIAPRTGSVYVYSRNLTTWTFEQELHALDAEGFDQFGESVSLDAAGTRLAVGARNWELPVATSDEQGAAYVFLRTGTTWTQEQRVVAIDRANGDGLGYSIALSADGTRMLVGALDEDDNLQGLTDNGAVYVFERSGTLWSQRQKLYPAERGSMDYFGYAIGMNDAGTRWLIGSLAHDDAEGTTTFDNGAAWVFVRGAIGEACTDASECESGFCVDQTCCESSCGGGATDDCMACSTASTGDLPGLCLPLHASIAPTVTCRAAAIGSCDVAETCAPTSTSCPADAVAAAGSVCRPSIGPCDVADTCDGTSPTCPVDAVSSAGTVCAPAAGGCDVAEVCTGASPACPANAVLPTGTVCRAASDICDAPEACDGLSVACPGDVLLTSTTLCRAALGPCDVAEACTGTSPACPANAFAPQGSLCNAAIGVCDLPEVCSGTSALCPANVLVADTTPCDDGLGCTVTSACQGGVCQPSVSLDCTDGNPCTTDLCVEPGGCMHAPIAACTIDGGTATDAAVRPDASQPPDAGVPPPAAGGCSCRVGERRTRGSRGAAFAGLVAALLAGRRRAARAPRGR